MSLTGQLLAGSAVLAAGAAWALFRDRTVDSDDTGEAPASVEVAAAVASARGKPSLGARAVEVLSRRVGERGSGPRGTAGYHRSAFVDEVNRGVWNDAGDKLLGKPWCARALRWAYETAARELGQKPPFTAARGRLAAAADWKRPPLDAYKLSAPKVGAALVLGDRHATLVARVLSPTEVLTVEGNHGDAVAHVRRKIKADDTLVDVEAWVVASGSKRDGEELVAGLNLLGAEDN